MRASEVPKPCTFKERSYAKDTPVASFKQLGAGVYQHAMEFKAKGQARCERANIPPSPHPKGRRDRAFEAQGELYLEQRWAQGAACISRGSCGEECWVIIH